MGAEWFALLSRAQVVRTDVHQWDGSIFDERAGTLSEWQYEPWPCYEMPEKSKKKKIKLKQKCIFKSLSNLFIQQFSYF